MEHLYTPPNQEVICFESETPHQHISLFHPIHPHPTLPPRQPKRQKSLLCSLTLAHDPFHICPNLFQRRHHLRQDSQRMRIASTKPDRNRLIHLLLLLLLLLLLPHYTLLPTTAVTIRCIFARPSPTGWCTVS